MTEQERKEKLAKLEEEWRKFRTKRKILFLKLNIVNDEIARIEKEIKEL